jgi:hypothetical protein
MPTLTGNLNEHPIQIVTSTITYTSTSIYVSVDFASAILFHKHLSALFYLRLLFRTIRAFTILNQIVYRKWKKKSWKVYHNEIITQKKKWYTYNFFLLHTFFFNQKNQTIRVSTLTITKVPLYKHFINIFEFLLIFGNVKTDNLIY